MRKGPDKWDPQLHRNTVQSEPGHSPVRQRKDEESNEQPVLVLEVLPHCQGSGLNVFVQVQTQSWEAKYGCFFIFIKTSGLSFAYTQPFK